LEKNKPFIDWLINTGNYIIYSRHNLTLRLTHPINGNRFFFQVVKKVNFMAGFRFEPQQNAKSSADMKTFFVLTLLSEIAIVRCFSRYFFFFYLVNGKSDYSLGEGWMYLAEKFQESIRLVHKFRISWQFLICFWSRFYGGLVNRASKNILYSAALVFVLYFL
jgi:hypothetical protein